LLGETMKKIIIFLFCLTIIYSISNQKEEILIPEEALRFRVIANSNSKEDQQLKLEIKEDVEKEINRLMLQAKDIQEARELMKENLPMIENIVKNYHVSFQMNFGNNVFPEKEYKGVTYPAGSYESLVITLGSGLGNNWWCVMFPPLCLLESKDNNLEDVEYQFFVKNVINQYLE